MTTTVLQAIEPVMNEALGASAARGVFRTLPTWVSQNPGSLDVLEVRELLSQLETSGRLFAAPGRSVPVKQLREAMTGGVPAKPNEQRFAIASDRDVLTVQRATQQLTRGFFGLTDCVRLATAASELARNIYMYAKQGVFTLRLSEEPTAYLFELSAVDNGPGISNLDAILRGQYHSRTGLGRGLAGTKVLLDELKVDSSPGKGTRITGHRRARKA
jgi:anti-sigma regulatory factor (Ser/Thr protein kinase)